MHAVANSSLHLASGGVFFAPHRGPPRFRHRRGDTHQPRHERPDLVLGTPALVVGTPALVTKTPHLNAWEYPATEAQPT
ncbi:NAD-dependent malic enzyme [Schaalia cardiffensis F0333]|uniref:NAD-dependent malic enzyme n=1 Tax=Schaalia cardiffensis F0333 TaxID=888050 RepID=N6WFW8_9ACTO|nr:hypothetical protein [Schaalia cardiffensis]ENO19124.1 NAD-dependent malic enzyme [Schaalia cardiffensis F0333]